MKKFLLRSAVVVAVAIGSLAVFVCVASRDTAPPDETEFAAVRPEVAPEDNAFTYFLEATNHLVEATNRQWLVDFRIGKTPPSDELRELIAKNAECLALLKRGTECAICLAPPVETIETPVPYVSPWLHMMEILEARLRLARLDRRFAEAADDLAVGMRFGDLVQKNASSLITYLVGVSMFSMSAESAMEMARDPAAPAEALTQLAAELKKVGPFNGGLVEALKAEHRMAINVVDGLGAKRDQRTMAAYLGFKTNRWATWFLNTPYSFKPNRTKRELAADHRHWIGNSSRIYAEMDRDGSDPEEPGRFSLMLPNVIGKYLFTILMPSWEKLLESKCRTDGILAGAKLVVACSRFQRDNGRWPAELQELVPDFLSEVPQDPYDGAPFRYSAEKGLVWAVGKNLTDEGGSMRIPGVEEGSAANRDRRRAEDFVFELRAREKAE